MVVYFIANFAKLFCIDVSYYNNLKSSNYATTTFYHRFNISITKRHHCKKEWNEKFVNSIVEALEEPSEAINVIKKYQTILKTQQHNMISIAYRTGHIIKWLKGTKRFSCMMTELGMSNSTMCFRICINY